MVEVPPCDEVTVEEFPINWWQLTSPGRDSFHSGGGDHGPHAFLVVGAGVRQDSVRPDPLPPWEGLLQPG